MLLLADCDGGCVEEDVTEDEAVEEEEKGLLRRMRKPLSPRFALRRVPRVLSKVKMHAVALPAGTSGCFSVDSYAYVRMSEGDPLPLLPTSLLSPDDEGLDGGVDLALSEEKDEDIDSEDEEEEEEEEGEEEEEEEGARKEAVDAMSDKSASSNRSGEAKNWAA